MFPSAATQWAPYGLLAGIISIVYLWTRRAVAASQSRTLPLPPGPQPLPFIGNMLDVPTKDLGRGFRQISDQYGKPFLLSLSLAG